MTQTSAYDIVHDYHRAWTSGDVESAMAHVADDIACLAPGVDLVGKDAYREFIAGFAPALTGLADIANFADGDRVALFTTPRPRPPPRPRPRSASPSATGRSPRAC